MADESDNRRDGPAERGLAEIRELRVDPDPDLAGRVQRDINRRTLAGDSLDFSFNVMVRTFWDHLQSVIEAWPLGRARASTDGDDDER